VTQKERPDAGGNEGEGEGLHKQKLRGFYK
jgi:hypothetical protein